MTPPDRLAIRAAHPPDETFLWQILALTADLPPAEPPSVEATQRDPGLSPYLAGWGRAGDTGVVAEIDEVLVGAAWYRSYSADKPGYGFVAEAIPEISLGVLAAWRGRGVGRALLTALVDEARRGGIEALSLSVDAANEPALRLYRSVGFRTVGGSAGNPTMLLEPLIR